MSRLADLSDRQYILLYCNVKTSILMPRMFKYVGQFVSASPLQILAELVFHVRVIYTHAGVKR